MISYLKGKIILKEEKFVIIDVGGIGYKVFLSSSRINLIAKNEKERYFFCSLKIKKDSWDLYGFLSLDELELFDFLVGVSGIGPKTALEISSLGSLDKIKKAIKEDDQKIINELFRLGKKKAQTIIFEISRELKTKDSSEDKELIKPLSKLGFSKKEIKEAIAGLSKKDQTTEEKMKELLKTLGK